MCVREVRFSFLGSCFPIKRDHTNVFEGECGFLVEGERTERERTAGSNKNHHTHITYVLNIYLDDEIGDLGPAEYQIHDPYPETKGLHVCTFTYSYIYIYIERERE